MKYLVDGAVNLWIFGENGITKYLLFNNKRFIIIIREF